MYETNTQIIIDSLVDQIRKLRVDVLVKDAEIEQLKDKLAEKTSRKEGTTNA